MIVYYFCCYFFSLAIATTALRIHDVEIAFNTTRHPNNGRHLSYAYPIIVVFRNHTLNPIPLDASCVLGYLSKEVVIVRAARYTHVSDDIVTEWLPAYKAKPNLRPPLLVHSLVPIPQASSGGAEYYILPSTTTPQFIDTLVNDPNVVSLEEVPAIEFYSREARRVHLPDLVNQLGLGAGRIVAIADDHLDHFHCSFYDPTHALSFQQSVVPQQHSSVASYVGAAPGITDNRGPDASHGTATTSQAVGRECSSHLVGTADSGRVAFYNMGRANGELFLPLDPRPGHFTFPSWIDQVFTTGGASAMSLSWGADTRGQYSYLTALVDRKQREHPKKPIVISAGNSGQSSANYFTASPGNGKNPITAGATAGTGDYYWSNAPPDVFNSTMVADFSSHGPLPGGRISPVLYSLGVYEYVALGLHDASVGGHNSQYRVRGTSFSAPTLAGLVTQLQNEYHRVMGTDPTRDYVLVKLLLRSERLTGVVNTDTLAGLRETTAPTPTYGYGVPVIRQGELDTIWEDTLSTGSGRRVYCLRASESAQHPVFRAALTYLDMESVPYSSQVLINDVDVFVVLRDKLLMDGFSASNTHEFFRSPAPVSIEAGDWLRVVVYEKDDTIVGAPNVSFAFGVNGEWTRFASSTECGGDCFPTESIACESGRTRFCNTTSGFFTECLPSHPAHRPETRALPCTHHKFAGYFRSPGDGDCVPYECHPGYFFDENSQQCTCVQGYRLGNRECDVGELRAMDVPETQPPVPQPVIASGAAGGHGGQCGIVQVLVFFLSLYIVL